MTKLQHALDAAGIQFFRADELTRLPRWDVSATVPDELIDHIIPTVRIAEAIRAAWGGPVRVVSGYRPVAYNREVGSNDTSQHVFFRALDLAPVRGSMREFHRVCTDVVREHRRDRAVGLGLYDAFIHIDTGGHQHSRSWDFRRTTK
jgi:uncharacterized protein YcbK (DUF882 family)